MQNSGAGGHLLGLVARNCHRASPSWNRCAFQEWSLFWERRHPNGHSCAHHRRHRREAATEAPTEAAHATHARAFRQRLQDGFGDSRILEHLLLPRLRRPDELQGYLLAVDGPGLLNHNLRRRWCQEHLSRWTRSWRQRGQIEGLASRCREWQHPWWRRQSCSKRQPRGRRDGHGSEAQRTAAAALAGALVVPRLPTVAAAIPGSKLVISTDVLELSFLSSVATTTSASIATSAIPRHPLRRPRRGNQVYSG
mmetsp:Transcript_57581/g.122462  ORF Transcript_57581/g.122462 Transcript_57581/m.122462 type:complete len:252 (+) Transcript_57581:649-1404(+)